MPLVYVVTAAIALTFWGISFKRVAAATLEGLIEQLTKAIHDFTVAYNENAVLFVGRKREVRVHNSATLSSICAIGHVAAAQVMA